MARVLVLALQYYESIAIGIASLFFKFVLVLVLAILFIGYIGISIANTFL